MVKRNKINAPPVIDSIDLIEDLHIGAPSVWRLNWSYSGRYARASRSIPKYVRRPLTLERYPATTAPSADMQVLMDPRRAMDTGMIPKERLAIEVRVDIDGSDPLNVVSGSLTELELLPRMPVTAHFIGQVVENNSVTDGRELTVEEFTFTWPGTGETIDRLVVKLTPELPSEAVPTAQISFLTTSGRTKGPFDLSRTSRYFHDVEIEVDMEDNAIDPEPYNTHTHPDRPVDLPNRNLTFDSCYRRAGINITRTAGSEAAIDSSEAGGDLKWTELELHDAMEDQWRAFANCRQWKMWVFLAEEAVERDLAGVMFDAYIDEPGGVDRQGTAIFTRCPALHAEFAADNPPGPEAIERELMTLMVHEAGHAFNLYHPWRKTAASPWSSPAWMPSTDRNLALTWMNYSWQASSYATGASSFSSQWFYENFDFRFDDVDNLFLRHAPDRFVIMGGSDWGVNHGVVFETEKDPRLEMVLRSRKSAFEMGEPVTIELRLKNVSRERVTIDNGIDLQTGMVAVALCDLKGQRTPYLPFIHNDKVPQSMVLEPGQAIYRSVSLATGIGGCPFKLPGTYRIEACYRMFDGRAAAGSMYLAINPPASPADWPIVQELFNARVGRVLYVGGSRTMTDVLDRIQWVSGKIGKRHPAQFHLASALSLAFARPSKIIDRDAGKTRLLEPDPERVTLLLAPVMARPDEAADTLGHIAYTNLVNVYADCAATLPRKGQAAKALREMLELYEKRKVVKAVIDNTRKRLESVE